MIHLTTVQKMQLSEKINSFFNVELFDTRSATCPECEVECDLDGQVEMRIEKRADLDLFVDDLIMIIRPQLAEAIENGEYFISGITG